MKKTQGIGFGKQWFATALSLCALLTTGTAHAVDISATGTQAAASDQWNLATWVGGQWSDGLAPSAGKTYSTGAFQIRTLNSTSVSGHTTFGGDSLRIVAGGSLLLRNGNDNVVNGNLILDGGSLISGRNLTGGNAQDVAGNLDIASASTIDLTLGGASQARITCQSGNFTGSGDITMTGTANTDVLDLTSTLIGSHTGDWTISGGRLVANLDNQIGDSASVTLGSATAAFFEIRSDQTIGSLSGNGTVQASGTRILTTGGDSTSTTFDGVITTAGIALRKEGDGTFTLSNNNTYTGTTAINGGTLLVNGSHVAAGAYTVANNATLGGSGTINSAVTVNNGGTLAPGATTGTAGTLTVGGLTFNSTSVAKFDLATATTEGGGVNDLVAVNGDLAAGGTIQINALSDLTLGSPYRLFNYTGNLTGSFAVTVLNPGYGATLDTSTPGQVNVSFGAPIQTLTWKGTPALYTWDVNVSATWTNGTAMSVFQNGDAVVFDGTAENNVANLVDTLLPQSVTVNSSADVTLQGSGSLSGGMSLSKAGSGTLNLKSANTYSGTTTIGAGTLNANSTDALGNGSSGNTLFFDGGTLQAGGTITSPAARNVTLTSTGVIDSNNNDLSIAGLMSGAGGLTKSGVGTLTSSAFNTFTGPLTINNGTLEFTTTGFDYNKDVFKSTQININNGSTLKINSSVNNDVIPMFDGRTYTFDSNGGGSILLGTGNHNAEATPFTIRTLGGAQDTIGLLSTSGENGFNLGGTTVTFDVTLGTDAASDLTVTPIISNNGSVLKTGTGRLTLTGANTYRGGTTVTNGTLLVNNATGSGTGTNSVTVNNNATLGGVGSLSGAVTINNNSTLAPGTNSVAGGVLTCAGGLTLAAGVTNAFDCTASACDRVAVTGALTLQGANTVALTLTGATVPKEVTLFTFDSVTGDEHLTSWTVTGLPPLYKSQVLKVGNSIVVRSATDRGTMIRFL